MMYAEVGSMFPERSDFDQIRFKVISSIAFAVWEKLGKPQHRDMDIWLKAEQVWEYIRYYW